jgi:hypothetical protein
MACALGAAGGTPWGRSSPPARRPDAGPAAVSEDLQVRWMSPSSEPGSPGWWPPATLSCGPQRRPVGGTRPGGGRQAAQPRHRRRKGRRGRRPVGRANSAQGARPRSRSPREDVPRRSRMARTWWGSTVRSAATAARSRGSTPPWSRTPVRRSSAWTGWREACRRRRHGAPRGPSSGTGRRCGRGSGATPSPTPRVRSSSSRSRRYGPHIRPTCRCCTCSSTHARPGALTISSAPRAEPSRIGSWEAPRS